MQTDWKTEGDDTRQKPLFSWECGGNIIPLMSLLHSTHLPELSSFYIYIYLTSHIPSKVYHWHEFMVGAITIQLLLKPIASKHPVFPKTITILLLSHSMKCYYQHIEPFGRNAFSPHDGTLWRHLWLVNGVGRDEVCLCWRVWETDTWEWVLMHACM